MHIFYFQEISSFHSFHIVCKLRFDIFELGFSIFYTIDYSNCPCGVGGVDRASSSDARGSGFEPLSV